MRAEAMIASVGLVAAAALLAGRWALLPGPPPSELRPRADSLEALTPYLAAGPDGAASATGGGAGTGSTRATGAIRLARDPFTAGGAPPGPSAGPGEGSDRSTSAGWSLSAIMISEDRRLAIIDDRVVEAGDTLAGGTRVLAVDRDHVTLLGPDGVRRRVALNR